MKWIALLILLALLAPLSVGAQSYGYQWCFYWDFRTQNQLTINAGYWFSGVGYGSLHTLVPSSYTLELSYVYDQIVMPTQIMLRIKNEDQQSANTFEASGSVFGVPISITESLQPGETRDFVAAGGADWVGTGLDLVIDSDFYVILQTMVIYGDAENPFPSTDCSGQDPIVLPAGGIIEALATSQALIAQVEPAAANLPNENGAALFAYAKYLLSPTAAQEVAGPFATIYWHIGLAVQIAMFMMGIYAVIWLVAHLVKWAVWLFEKIMTLIRTLAAVVDSVLGFLLKFIGL